MVTACDGHLKDFALVKLVTGRGLPEQKGMIKIVDIRASLTASFRERISTASRQNQNAKRSLLFLTLLVLEDELANLLIRSNKQSRIMWRMLEVSCCWKASRFLQTFGCWCPQKAPQLDSADYFSAVIIMQYRQ
jgi:hypothetical protein